jgi:hypothetical protein
MIDPLKPIGAFIENTIRPLLDEFHWFFEECEKKGIPINENSIIRITDYISRAHFRTVFLHFAQSIVITIILCLTWLICQK